MISLRATAISLCARPTARCMTRTQGNASADRGRGSPWTVCRWWWTRARFIWTGKNEMADSSREACLADHRRHPVVDRWLDSDGSGDTGARVSPDPFGIEYPRSRLCLGAPAEYVPEG